MSVVALQSLTHAVQAHNGRFWETIAAFNVDRVAINYALGCVCSNKGIFRYRVVSTRDGSTVWEE